ncbi:MAG: hypothetical protein DSY81_05495 [Bacillota bacterium]|nr:MAG: hypothetical protein DSY92_00555 [Planctomycetota bacterium]RUA09805.1 MAG: hypothetical protein DSY81_05495 [Bacillota bacterium]
MRSRLPRILLILAWLSMPGCDSRSPLPEPPQLVGLEQGVVEHLDRTYATLQQAQESLTGIELGAAYGDAAITYHAYDLPMTAHSCYQRALDLDPDTARWKYLMAMIKVQLGQEAQATRLYLEVLELIAEHPPTLAALGELKLEVGEPEVAGSYYRRLLDLQPNSAPALAALGKIALEADRPQLAVDFLEQALSLSPAASGLRYPLGLALRDLGHTDRAIEQMKARGDAYPRVANPWLDEVKSRPVGARIALNRGTTLFQEGLFEQARDQFEQACSAAPESATAHLNLGSALAKLNLISEAIAEYEQAILLDPDSTIAWFDLGVIHASLNQESQAIRCYDQALLIHPDNAEARFNRANALRRLGNYLEAAAEMKMVRTLRPGNSTAWLAEAVCYLRIEQRNAARMTCIDGRIATGNDARLISLSARITATDPSPTTEQLASHLEEIEQLLKVQTTLELVETKAMLLAAQGLFEEAIEWQNAALEAALGAGREDIARRLTGNRDRYSRGVAASDPWPEESSGATSDSGGGKRSTSQ